MEAAAVVVVALRPPRAGGRKYLAVASVPRRSPCQCHSNPRSKRTWRIGARKPFYTPEPDLNLGHLNSLSQENRLTQQELPNQYQTLTAMDDLFADEQSLPQDFDDKQQQQHPHHCSDMVLTDSRSYEDPALLRDRRVLRNILDRQRHHPSRTDYFSSVQKEVKPHMRKIVSDWMLEVCEEQQCQPEVFSLAVDYLDRFLSAVAIKKSQFQLLGCVCMFLASKFKETAPLPAENLVIYTDNSVTTQEIMVRPKKILFEKTMFLTISLLPPCSNGNFWSSRCWDGTSPPSPPTASWTSSSAPSTPPRPRPPWTWTWCAATPRPSWPWPLRSSPSTTTALPSSPWPAWAPPSGA